MSVQLKSTFLRSVIGRTDATELKLTIQKDLGSHFVNDEKDVPRVTDSQTCHSSNQMRRTKEGCKGGKGLSFTVGEEELHGRLDEAGDSV
jgi:hypothetical protein